MNEKKNVLDTQRGLYRMLSLEMRLPVYRGGVAGAPNWRSMSESSYKLRSSESETLVALFFDELLDAPEPIGREFGGDNLKSGTSTSLCDAALFEKPVWACRFMAGPHEGESCGEALSLRLRLLETVRALALRIPGGVARYALSGWPRNFRDLTVRDAPCD